MHTWAKILRKFVQICGLLITSVVSLRIRLDGRRSFGSYVGSGQLVEFVPFLTPACLAQHQVVAAAVRGVGLKAQVRVGGLAEIQVNNPQPSGMVSDRRFHTFSGLVDFLESLGEDSPRMARAIIDSFVRSCDLSVFSGNFVVKESFVRTVFETVSRAANLVSGASALVIADSAYIGNSAIVVEAEKQKKRCWVLQPEGRFFQAFSGVDEETLGLGLPEVRDIMAHHPDVLKGAERYFDDRRGGLLDADYDAKVAYVGRSDLERHHFGKKVLFLHAFRDANLIPLQTETGEASSLFRTYFEWTDFAFSVIRERPDDWLIRPHPLSKAFPSDSIILDYLISKHDLQNVPILESESTDAILNSQLPIFTHSGTVALESAALGYKAVVCSRRFPSEVCFLPSSTQELRCFMESNDCELISPRVDASTSALAKTLLYLNSTQNRIPFAAVEPQPNPLLPLRREKELAIQLMKLLSTLSDSTVRRKVSEVALKIALSSAF